MAKTIKFNLICDERPIRTIENLRENFSIEDVLDYYNSRLLHRWLKVRGYDEALEKVEAVQCEKPVDIVKELVKIFDVSTNQEEIEQSVYMLDFLKEREESQKDYEQNSFKSQQIIEDYEAGYRKLVDGILNNPTDTAKIKANIKTLTEQYSWILDLNYAALFWKVAEEAPLAVLYMLMNDKFRKYYLPEKNSPDKTDEPTLLENFDRELQENIFSWIKQYIAELKQTAQDNKICKTFAGDTDGYWKDLEPKGKRCMIISMEYGNYVRSAGQRDGDLSSYDIQDRFVILDGVDYKSNHEWDELFYMEV